MRIIYYRVLSPSDDCLLYLAYPLTISIASCLTTPFLVVLVARTGGGALSRMEVKVLAAAW
jgi:hypothetical protein